MHRQTPRLPPPVHTHKLTGAPEGVGGVGQSAARGRGARGGGGSDCGVDGSRGRKARRRGSQERAGGVRHSPEGGAGNGRAAAKGVPVRVVRGGGAGGEGTCGEIGNAD